MLHHAHQRRLAQRQRIASALYPIERAESWPLEQQPADVLGPHVFGLGVFSAISWFAGVTIVSYEPRAGLIVGALAGWIVIRAGKPSSARDR